MARPKKKKIKGKEYDELYPDDYPKVEKKKLEKTTKDVPKKTDSKLDMKKYIENRLIGIQNIADEWGAGKFEKIKRLAKECIDKLEKL